MKKGIVPRIGIDTDGGRDAAIPRNGYLDTNYTLHRQQQMIL